MILKTIGHLFYATSSFVHHFVAIGEFKLELQPETPYLRQNRQYLEPCDLAILRMTFENNRAPLLCYLKLYASFRSHWWTQTRVTVRKPTIWVKFNIFYLCDLDLWPLTLNFCMEVAFVLSNKSWKFRDDTMMGTLTKRCYRRTDRQTVGLNHS